MLTIAISFLLISAATLSYQYSCYLQYKNESAELQAKQQEAFEYA